MVVLSPQLSVVMMVVVVSSVVVVLLSPLLLLVSSMVVVMVSTVVVALFSPLLPVVSSVVVVVASPVVRGGSGVRGGGSVPTATGGVVRDGGSGVMCRPSSMVAALLSPLPPVVSSVVAP